MSQQITQAPTLAAVSGSVRERVHAVGKELAGLSKVIDALEAQLLPVTRNVPDGPRTAPGNEVAEPGRPPQCEIALVLDATHTEVRSLVDHVNRIIDRLEI